MKRDKNRKSLNPDGSWNRRVDGRGISTHASIITSLEARKPAEKQKIRIILYSHDTMGLGHIRRNLLLAQALHSSPLPFDVLLITGAKEVGQFALPADVDCLVLPALYKEQDGQYRSRRLALPLNEIVALRSQTILAAVRSFQPDVMVVDNVPRGACGELDETLKFIQNQEHIRCILGLRDIKDSPETVKREWYKEGFEQVIRRCYDDIWVYGDKEIYDPVKEYDLPPDIVKKVKFTGYLNQQTRLAFAEENEIGFRQISEKICGKPFVLCMVGGGQDGVELAESFIKITLPDNMQGLVLTGPHMSDQERERLLFLAQKYPGKMILDFVSEPVVFLKNAWAVISMGGYNSVSEILSFRKPALIVPRVKPREEQLIRAQRLNEKGVIDMLHPDDLSPESLESWIENIYQAPHAEQYGQINMDGLTCVPRLLQTISHSKQKRFIKQKQAALL